MKCLRQGCGEVATDFVELVVFEDQRLALQLCSGHAAELQGFIDGREWALRDAWNEAQGLAGEDRRDPPSLAHRLLRDIERRLPRIVVDGLVGRPTNMRTDDGIFEIEFRRNG